jgi:hypothetical protein
MFFLYILSIFLSTNAPRIEKVLHLNGFLVSPISGQAVLVLLYLNFSDCIFILKILVA